MDCGLGMSRTSDYKALLLPFSKSEQFLSEYLFIEFEFEFALNCKSDLFVVEMLYESCVLATRNHFQIKLENIEKVLLKSYTND